MGRFGFCGPSYTSQSITADCQQAMNWYPESIESQLGKSAMALYPTPGLSVFAALPSLIAPTRAVRGMLAIDGRLFAVGGPNLYEVYKDGSNNNRGNIGDDYNQVTMASNGADGNQLVVCSAGNLYSLDLTANVLSGPILGLQGTVSMVVYCSGYFVALLANSNKFQVSALLDGTTWNPLGVEQVLVFPENVAAIVSAFNQLWVYGLNGHTQVYYNSGASAVTPFDVIPGAFMEEGISAPSSLAVLDNTPSWIGGYQTGIGIAWRANGYSPSRISNHAVETAWAAYPSRGTDAIGYAYRDQGHTFWVLRFPSANQGFGATWVYDTATQMWHERGHWSPQSPSGWTAHNSTCHAFCFGQNLVGDWNTGVIYAMSIYTYQDNGQPIRRVRRAPHISVEQVRIFHSFLQVDVEVGDGPMPPLLDGAGEPRGPQMILRWSNDGGRTWSNEYVRSAGQTGEYRQRVYWNRLGQARDRVYEVSVTDPVPWRIVDAYLKAGSLYQLPQQRLSQRYEEIT
jgi:hypothetical protein